MSNYVDVHIKNLRKKLATREDDPVIKNHPGHRILHRRAGMKIRKKITLWISGAALLSTIVFSSIIFWEMTEEPFKLIDKEIAYMASALTERIRTAQMSGSRIDPGGMPYNPDHYWIMARDDTGKILYKSKLTEFTDLTELSKKSVYVTERHIPRSKIWLKQDAADDVMFRAMVVQKQINGQRLEIRIAKPIEDLEEELISPGRKGGWLSFALCAGDCGFKLCPCRQDPKACGGHYPAIQGDQREIFR